MATKQTTQSDVPDKEEILSAISDAVGRLGDIDSQKDLLRGLLVPKYTTGVTEDEIERKVIKVRDQLRTFMASKGMSYTTGWGRFTKSKTYTRQHLFEMGPEKTVKEEWLFSHGWEPDVDLDEAEDSSSVAQIKNESDLPAAPDQKSLVEEVIAIDTPRPTPGAETVPPVGASPEIEMVDAIVVEVVSSRDIAPSNTHEELPETSSKATASRTGQKCSSSEPATPEAPAQKRQKSAPPHLASPPQTVNIETTSSAAAAHSPNTTIEPIENDHQSAREPSAALREAAKIPPTRQPKNPDGIINRGDSSWVRPQMGLIEDAIWNAVSSYFQDKNIDPDAHSTLLDEKASKKLLDLYEATFGKKD
ncbi:hypothetical protein CLAFUR4_03784 [Fulvia fulva]|nr:hypothetical protein CLAFUR4_03784 [Fulvia fulva]WPV25668.1 hypothetical protein CLAFUW7_03788 [Fulvia fulva]